MHITTLDNVRKISWGRETQERGWQLHQDIENLLRELTQGTSWATARPHGRALCCMADTKELHRTVQDKWGAGVWLASEKGHTPYSSCLGPVPGTSSLGGSGEGSTRHSLRGRTGSSLYSGPDLACGWAAVKSQNEHSSTDKFKSF